jgi:hypothetical protein
MRGERALGPGLQHGSGLFQHPSQKVVLANRVLSSLGLARNDKCIGNLRE